MYYGDIERDQQIFWNIPYPLSEAPMGNVTSYLQKLGMGVYDNKKSARRLKNNLNLGEPRFSTRQLEVN